ncbi:MAG: bifunctional 3-(3-hydroxy-phenyl)propionate/3-hydroxycinnamic acid hydroxylase [Pseudomonadota bacterium]
MKFSDSEACEVVIVGAGPTGLMLGNLLGTYGVRCRILERREEPFTEPRAIAYDPETLRLFQAVGCYEGLEPTLLKDVPVSYLNAAGKTLAHIYACPPSFGHSGRGTYYQPELEQALIYGLAGHQEVELVRGVEVTDVRETGDYVVLSLRCGDEEAGQLKARYVVDCSGGSSQIRRQLGIDFAGNTFREKWLVIDVVGDDYEDQEIKFFCDPNRPAVTLPVSKSRRRWEFLVMPGDDEEELASESSARALMASYGAGKADSIERSLVYTFHARMAQRFRAGRVILAGDAAHVMPPFAGQGLNSGMRDAANLSWKLAGVVAGRFDDQLLDTYELERRLHVEAMTKLAIKLGRSIMPTSAMRAWMRDLIMLTSWRFKRTRESVNRGDMIPKPSIAKSSLVNWKRGTGVGRMLEQPRVTKNGESLLLDDLLGSGFVVIGVNCRASEDLHPRDLQILEQHLQANSVFITTSRDEHADGRDDEGVLTDLIKRERGLLIVRPDRFLIDIVDANSSAPQLDWLADRFCLKNEVDELANLSTPAVHQQ